MEIKDIKIEMKVKVVGLIPMHKKTSLINAYEKAIVTVGDESQVEELDLLGHWQDVKLTNGIWYSHNDLQAS